MRTLLPYRCAIFVIYFLSFRLWSPKCIGIATRKFTICGIFKCFNGKLLAPRTYTIWAKNRLFWALFRWAQNKRFLMGWCNITPFLLNASTYLHADCISRTATEYSISKRRDVHFGPKTKSLLWFWLTSIDWIFYEIGRCSLKLFNNHRVHPYLISALYHIMDILSALYINWHAYTAKFRISVQFRA